MCGPIMLTFVGPHQRMSTFLFYHTGRLLSYGLIGLFLGFLGQSLQLFQLQQVITILLGTLLLIIYAIPGARSRIERFYYQSRFYRLVNALLSKNLSMRRKWFISGMANGFLPCGLTYVAAATAIALGSLTFGLLSMLLFGLGTLPILIAFSFGLGHLTKRFKSVVPKSIPVIAVLSGAILLLRGLLMTFPDFNNLVAMKAAGLITICGM